MTVSFSIPMFEAQLVAYFDMPLVVQGILTGQTPAGCHEVLLLVGDEHKEWAVQLVHGEYEGEGWMVRNDSLDADDFFRNGGVRR